MSINKEYQINFNKSSELLPESIFQTYTKNVENENSVIEFCKKHNKQLVVMPSGQKAIYFEKYLKQHGINIAYFMDNNSEKHGVLLNNIKVLSFDEFSKNKKDFTVIICTNPDVENALGQQLKNEQFDNYYIEKNDFIGYNNIEIDNPSLILHQNYDRYINLFNNLNDNISKHTLNNRILYLLTQDRSFLEKIKMEETQQYFDIIHTTKDDCFVDCGAFTGDTLEQCYEKYGEVAAYYAFEPDEKNFIKLQQHCKKYNNAISFKEGVWFEDATLNFSNTGNSSTSISDDGGAVKVISLDNKLSNKKVTVIKMDVEGAEIEALKGAKKIITEQNPTLAICVYHKFNDIWDIPELIQSFDVDYKYYLRHYTNTVCETVFYAVPKR